MFSKEKALRLAVIVLMIIGGLDFFRGFMHTFNIWWASENIAKMSQTADTLFLMNTFGISNFLTGAIFFLVAIKARQIAPHILVLVPLTYMIGLISARLTGVSAMQVSDWKGQYFMVIYLAAIALVGINYFIASVRSKRGENA